MPPLNFVEVTWPLLVQRSRRGELDAAVRGRNGGKALDPRRSWPRRTSGWTTPGSKSRRGYFERTASLEY